MDSANHSVIKLSGSLEKSVLIKNFLGLLLQLLIVSMRGIVLGLQLIIGFTVKVVIITCSGLTRPDLMSSASLWVSV